MSSTIVTINPATGAELGTYPAMTDAQIDAALDHAAAAQLAWAGEDFKVRGEILRAAAGVLRERDDELALLVTREMGKPLTESLAEVHKCATGLEFYADHAHEFLTDETTTPPRTVRGSPMNRSASSWPSCRGTSRCGRSSGSPRRVDGR